jgi:hypothetical protein
MKGLMSFYGKSFRLVLREVKIAGQPQRWYFVMKVMQ